MSQQTTLIIRTKGRRLYEITQDIQLFVKKSMIETGICNIFLQHTSASLILCENADLSVQRDLEYFISTFVKDGDKNYTHDAEGLDDMSAHIRTIITQNSISIPIKAGQCALGTWQGIFLWEHRYQPHQRYLVVTILD